MKTPFYLVLLFLCIQLMGLYSCSDDSPFHVTYKVSIDSDKPHRVLVHYKDSTDYVVIRIDKDWTKEVSLSHRDLASLLIINEQSPDDYFATYFFTCENKNILKGQIISGEKTVTEFGENIVSINLFAHNR